MLEEHSVTCDRGAFADDASLALEGKKGDERWRGGAWAKAVKRVRRARAR